MRGYERWEHGTTISKECQVFTVVRICADQPLSLYMSYREKEESNVMDPKLLFSDLDATRRVIMDPDTTFR